jgi:bacteriocin-like protein
MAAPNEIRKLTDEDLNAVTGGWAILVALAQQSRVVAAEKEKVDDDQSQVQFQIQ